MQGGSIQLFNNFGNLLQRLPVRAGLMHLHGAACMLTRQASQELQAAGNFCGLPKAEELQSRVQAKQIKSLGAVLDRLHASMWVNLKEQVLLK